MCAVMRFVTITLFPYGRFFDTVHCSDSQNKLRPLFALRVVVVVKSTPMKAGWGDIRSKREREIEIKRKKVKVKVKQSHDRP